MHKIVIIIIVLVIQAVFILIIGGSRGLVGVVRLSLLTQSDYLDRLFRLDMLHLSATVVESGSCLCGGKEFVVWCGSSRVPFVQI